MKINGRQIAKKILVDLRKRVKKLQEKNLIPHLAIVLIGNDPASNAYVKQKILTAKRVGIKTSLFKYPNSISEKNLLSCLNDLNHLSNIHGIIVQRPLPAQIDTRVIARVLDPANDLDGFHPHSLFQSPLAMAVLEILKNVFGRLRDGVAPAAHLEGEFKNWLKSQKIVVIGKGETGGQPIIETLRKIDIAPTIVDSKTKNPSNLTKNADIIISAVGKENVVKAEMIRKNCILISIGLSKGKDGKLHGDYDEEKIKNIALFYTPTPGGVGPVNVAMLLKNLVTTLDS